MFSFEEINHFLTLDRNVLRTIRDLQIKGKPDIFKKVIENFLDDTKKTLLIISDALDKYDFEIVQRSAHRLKSSCASVGAMKLSAMYKELEKQAVSQSLTRMAQVTAAINDEFDLVVKELHKEIEADCS